MLDTGIKQGAGKAAWRERHTAASNRPIASSYSHASINRVEADDSMSRFPLTDRQTARHPAATTIRFALSIGSLYPASWADQIRDGYGYLLVSPLSRTRACMKCDSKPLIDGQIRPGMLFLVAPGEQLDVALGTPARTVAVIFSREEFVRILSEQKAGESSDGLSSVNSLLRPSYQVERLAMALVSTSELGCDHQKLFLEGLARALIACLVGSRAAAPSGASHRPRALTEEELQRSIEYADSMMDGRINLHTWASVLGLSPTEFARRFQNKTLEAPYAWFMNRRIERAKQMLLDPSHSLVDIALETGFYSQSHFTEAFRRRVGSSPARWRSEVRHSLSAR